MHKTIIAVTLLLLYVLPVVLIYFEVLPYKYRLSLLGWISLFMILYCIVRRFSWQELGISKLFLKESLLWNGLYSAITILVIVILFKTNIIRKAPPVDYDNFYYYYILFSCPCQEFLYRSIIYAEWEREKWLPYFVVFSTLNYTFLHIIYHDSITLIVTFIAGLVWGCIYKKYPNFWGVALSHAVLGALSIVTGLI